MAQSIIIDIAADGTVSINAEGFTDSSCSVATKQIEQVLAGGGRIKRDEKPGFNAPAAIAGQIDTRAF